MLHDTTAPPDACAEKVLQLPAVIEIPLVPVLMAFKIAVWVFGPFVDA